MKTLIWQNPGQHFVAQELIKIIINHVAELRANTFTELEKADLVIAPDGLGSYSNYELEKAEEIFSAGYFAASKVLEGLEEDEKERYFSFR